MDFDPTDLSDFEEVTPVRGGFGHSISVDLRSSNHHLRFSCKALSRIMGVEEDDVPAELRLRLKYNKRDDIIYVTAVDRSALEEGYIASTKGGKEGRQTRVVNKPAQLKAAKMQSTYDQVVGHPNFFVAHRDDSADTELSDDDQFKAGDVASWMACPTGHTQHIRVKGIVQYIKKSPLNSNKSIAGMELLPEYHVYYTSPERTIAVNINRLQKEEL